MLHITKQFLKQQGISIDFKKVWNRFITGLKYGVPFLLISFTKSSDTSSEARSLHFDIVKKEKKLGYIHLKKIKENNTTKFEIKSEVNTKLLFNFRAKSQERYEYRGDTLVYSSIFRTMNNRVKVDQTIYYENGSYQLRQKNKQQKLNSNIIRCNLVKLFFERPEGISKVFCDKKRVYVKIIRMNAETYKVKFPDKSYTIFYYNDNRCEAIEAVGSFYHVRLIPKYSI